MPAAPPERTHRPRLGPPPGWSARVPWHAEAYTRGVNATGVTEIALSWFGLNGAWISRHTPNRLPTGNSGWSRLPVDATAPATATSVQLHLKSGDNTRTVHYDDDAIN